MLNGFSEGHFSQRRPFSEVFFFPGEKRGVGVENLSRSVGVGVGLLLYSGGALICDFAPFSCWSMSGSNVRVARDFHERSFIHVILMSPSDPLVHVPNVTLLP